MDRLAARRTPTLSPRVLAVAVIGIAVGVISPGAAAVAFAAKLALVLAVGWDVARAFWRASAVDGAVLTVLVVSVPILPAAWFLMGGPALASLDLVTRGAEALVSVGAGIAATLLAVAAHQVSAAEPSSESASGIPPGALRVDAWVEV